MLSHDAAACPSPPPPPPHAARAAAARMSKDTATPARKATARWDPYLVIDTTTTIKDDERGTTVVGITRQLKPVQCIGWRVALRCRSSVSRAGRAALPDGATMLQQGLPAPCRIPSGLAAALGPPALDVFYAALVAVFRDQAAGHEIVQHWLEAQDGDEVIAMRLQLLPRSLLPVQ